MTSQPGQQTIVIQILLDISQSKGTLTMKHCQVIEYNKGNNFFENHAKNDVARLVPDLLFFKGFIRGKSMWSAAQF